MGGTHRLAALAAASHTRGYYNHTQPEVVHTETPNYSINVVFVSATLCGVLFAMCVSMCRRTDSCDKPDDALVTPSVYTVSDDVRLNQIQAARPGPPPAYDTIIDDTGDKDCSLQEVVTESCPRCIEESSPRPDSSGLPSYEAAVMLRDTKL